MNDPVINWQYSNPRDATKALGCKHLQMLSSASMHEVPDDSRVSLSPTATPRMKLALSTPVLVLSCSSHDLNGRLSKQLDTVELQQQWVHTVVTADVCRLCPFWEKR